MEAKEKEAANGDSSRNLQRVANQGTSDDKGAMAMGSTASLDVAATGSKSFRYVKGTTIRKPPNPEAEGLKAMMLHPMNTLLIFLPLGVAAHYLKWGGVYCFWFNFFAMIPLAKILGDATEELAAALKNDMIAGLLNATFGNAVEVVITVNSLRAGLVRIVKTSLLGSVLSNTLLVLGMSFFFGGVMTLKAEPSDYNPVHPEDPHKVVSASKFNVDEKVQSFSLLGALVNTSMLLVSCMAFSLVTVFRMVLVEEGQDRQNIMLPVSRVSSGIIMLAYVAYILFQLVTHKEAMSDEGGGDDEEEEGHFTILHSLFILSLTTAIVAWCSDLLVDAIAGMTEGGHLSEHFIGIILLPIVGNACEHAAAVRFAVQDKLGLSVSIAVGSSTQIALFVVPLSVICGWSLNQDMDLNFGVLNTSLITLSVVVILSMVVDGQSNWLQGYLLMSVYAIIAVMYWNLPNDVNDGMD